MFGQRSSFTFVDFFQPVSCCWQTAINTWIFQDEEKRKLAQKEAEEERKKRHVKEEYQREKVIVNFHPWFL